MITSSGSIPSRSVSCALSATRRSDCSHQSSIVPRFSPDAVMALRNSGRGWLQIAGRWQLHAGDFHVALDPAQDPGPLARVYEGYRGSPRTGWPALQLEDREVEALVHLRFLTEYLGVPPGRVLTALARAGSGPAALQALRRGP